MQAFWNARYTEPDFAYGTQPNVFFRETIDQLPVGTLLLPAEGEGRNAVYAAQQGWNVTAFDFSVEARNRALKLAQERGVTIDYQLRQSQDFDPTGLAFDAIGLCYAHLPAALRADFHLKLAKALAPSGRIILEAFHKNQRQYTSGGPKDETMLFSVEELQKEFADLKIVLLEDCIVELDEGIYHQGKAHVVRMIAVRE